MDLSYSPEEKAFQADVRDWLRREMPEELADKVRKGQRMKKEDFLRWHALLRSRGFLAWHWPKEYGGTGWGPAEKNIFEEEMVAAGAPRIVPFGLTMLGPVLIKFGTDEQKKHYLPKILNDEQFWCQGYSEPGAGSDLASVRSTAVREGDHYVVNGQKTWTTYGHFADWIFLLVRTDPKAAKPQQGISFLLCDMSTPGIEVRPIVTLEGEHEVNEVYLTNVKIPVENLVGEENKGWTLAKYLLTFERTGIAGIGYSKEAIRGIKKAARDQQAGGRPLLENPLFAARLAEVEIDLKALEVFNNRIVWQAGVGQAPGAESSLLKIKGTQIRQETTDLMRRAVGPYAIPDVPEAFDAGWNGAPPGPAYALKAARTYFNTRKASIYGGSNEIQRNIVAKALLGL